MTFLTEDLNEIVQAISEIEITKPEGTLRIDENGEYNIKNYEKVDIEVPVNEPPVGTINITENGIIDVTNYSEADVNVTSDYTAKLNATYNINEGILSNGHLSFGGEFVLTIPDSVTSISNYAFSGCGDTLTTLIIPNSVTYIGDGAFYGCNALTTLTIPDSVTSIGEQAFSGCSALTIVDMTAFDGTKVPMLSNSNAFYAKRHAEDFKFVFSSQEALNAFVNETNWSDLAQYFEVAE